ncbi:hypothetical protein Tco_1059232 [Tanacetum coccineum]
MEDSIKVFDAKITIRSLLSFLTDVKNKLEEPGNDKRNTLFRATVKNERDSKKNKEIVLEPLKKKKKVDNSSKEKKKVEEEALKNMITYNLYGFVWSLKSVLRDVVEEILAEVLEPKKKLICSGGDTAEEQVQADSNIHSDVHVEDQNSPYPNMDKEHLFAEFDTIKAIVHIIDKRKGDVGSSCLEKELDLLKDKITVLEKVMCRYA